MMVTPNTAGARQQWSGVLTVCRAVGLECHGLLVIHRVIVAYGSSTETNHWSKFARSIRIADAVSSVSGTAAIGSIESIDIGRGQAQRHRAESRAITKSRGAGMRHHQAKEHP